MANRKEDTKGSAIVTMVGFPFQCTFVLESQPRERFFYCPHRFSNQSDAIKHVKAVHKGETHMNDDGSVTRVLLPAGPQNSPSGRQNLGNRMPHHSSVLG